MSGHGFEFGKKTLAEHGGAMDAPLTGLARFRRWLSVYWSFWGTLLLCVALFGWGLSKCSRGQMFEVSGEAKDTWATADASPHKPMLTVLAATRAAGGNFSKAVTISEPGVTVPAVAVGVCGQLSGCRAFFSNDHCVIGCLTGCGPVTTTIHAAFVPSCDVGSMLRFLPGAAGGASEPVRGSP